MGKQCLERLVFVEDLKMLNYRILFEEGLVILSDCLTIASQVICGERPVFKKFLVHPVMIL